MFGWESKGETHTPGKQSHAGGKGDIFEAVVNEALLLIRGAEERMTEWMTAMQADIPVDGSFHSKDKCYITPGTSTSNIPVLESQEWIVRQHRLRKLLFLFLFISSKGHLGI